MKIRENGNAHRTAEEWEEIVQRYESSGQSLRAFCGREDPSETTLWKWRGKLRGTAKSLARANFLEAKVATTPISNSEEGYEINLRGERSIRVTPPINSQALAELIRIVEKC